MDNAAREKWALTQEAFDGFLTALATDSDGAADRYLDIPATWYAFSSGATAPPRMIMRMKPSIDAPERLWKPAPTLAHLLSRFYLARAVQLWISRHLYLDRCIGSKLTGQTDRSVAPLSITISSCIHKDPTGATRRSCPASLAISAAGTFGGAVVMMIPSKVPLPASLCNHHLDAP